MWVDDSAFDIHRHVVRERLTRRKGQTERQALQALCGKLATEALDPARPLWQFHLVERYEGGSALIVRIHHCIGDGIALISVALSITDGGAEPPVRKARAADGEGDWLTDAVIQPVTEIVVKALDITGKGAARSAQALSQPLSESLNVAQVGYRLLGDVAALLLMPDDAATRLKGMPEGRKCVAWNEPLPIDAVKAIGKGLNCSINDVLLSCVAGAIGQYLRDHGDDPSGQEIRAMVPVNLRPLEQAWQLGNKFGLAPLVLPVGIDNPIERVYAVRQRMSELKGSYQPLLAFAVLAVAGLMIKPVQDAILDLFAKKTTAVMTNVPGPAKALHFCGREIRQTMFWVPASGHVGIGVSVLSYAGGVQFGLITDARLCPDPQAIIERFQPEFDKLLLVTLMLPWSAGGREPIPARRRTTPKPASQPSPA
jgi:WS/DGAT/MGAT family acyltransferase